MLNFKCSLLLNVILCILMFFTNIFEVFFDAKPFLANFILNSFLLSLSVVIFDSVSDSLYSLLSPRINLTATF